MDKIKLKNIVEAILVASDRVLSLAELEKMLFEKKPAAESTKDSGDEHHAANDAKTDEEAVAVDETATEDETAEQQSETQESPEATSLKRAIKEVLESLQDDYSGRAMELKEVASGYRFQVRQDYSDYVSKLWEERPAKYSRALLETLVLIAYRQPITRGEIEAIRGVSVSSHIIKTLVERDWVRVVGHRDVPGKPAIYGSTKEFLNYFNLKSLDELPSLADIKDLDKIVPELALGEATDEQGAGNIGMQNQPLSNDRQKIEVRQARRVRRMKRMFDKTAETDKLAEDDSTTSQENESNQAELS